ncbi:MAG TPA: vWA domain-containing protein [Polyangiaceae bacterium]|nr:vWA domain-containing protein [Polyangiaceae bacterium]
MPTVTRRLTSFSTAIVPVAFATVLACGSSEDGGGGRPSRPPGTSSSHDPSPASGGSTVQAPPPSSGGSTGPVIELQGGSGGSGGVAICNELEIEPTPVVPTVVLLVDNSSSMFEPREMLWDPLYSALMDPATGVVKQLENKVRFGFASFKGSSSPHPEDDAACADIQSVPPTLGNHSTIDTLYRDLGDDWMPGLKWETPTGHAIARVAADLAAFTADPPGPKYILLVTDGNPNTCKTLDPQCGQDLSVKAAQDAWAQGIGTFVVGIGDIVTTNTGCTVMQARCGTQHLQDLANAGQGLPVQEPPAEYQYQNCITNYPPDFPAVLQATYSSTPGNAQYFTATSQNELTLAIQGLLNRVLSCTVEMNAIVTGDPALGMVEVSGQSVTFNDPNGWQLESDNYRVTLKGTACDTFKATGDLKIQFPCDMQGRPVAKPR